MEVLSLILHKETLHSDFKYHWRAKDCNLTHLCFADDLLIFCHGNLASVTIVHSCIQSFSLFSGLIPNAQKSQCFFSNVDENCQHAIIDLLGFHIGSLPIRFLGVPLISSKLSQNDCMPLIQKITSRISSWTAKFLSYSGRLQLIKSVLFSIQSFWSAHFLLPKSVLRSIQSILSRFLWKGPSLGKHGAKISWKVISLPYSEGGLGVKDLEDWNKALIIQHLTKVIQFKPSSLWASWIQASVLKHNNFWHINIPTDCSWIWRKVLKLRSVAQRFLSYHVGRGNHFSLWYDPWLHGQFVSPNDYLLSNSGIPKSALLSSIISHSNWVLPQSNHHDVVQFRSLFTSAPSPSANDDSITWDFVDIRHLKVNKIWDTIRHRGSVVSWANILWHKHCVPRYSFFLWLALHKRFPTNDASCLSLVIPQ